LAVSGSLGVTLYPQTEEVDADQLLRQADQAMYQAKLAGKNRYQLFDSAQDAAARHRHEHIRQIRDALHRGEFQLFYQPKVNMRTGEIIGVEALIRWIDPELGIKPPSSFLPLIEDHPLALEVGDWVLETALRQISNWPAADQQLESRRSPSSRQHQYWCTSAATTAVRVATAGARGLAARRQHRRHRA